MKKMWKMKNDAVSPVIATILMVAITVVLAAVLYVMVMGFTPSGGGTPTLAFSSAAKGASTTEIMTFGPASKDVKPTDIKIVILNMTTGATTASLTYTFSSDSVTPQTLTKVGAGTICTSITYTDLGADSKVSSGDFLTIQWGGAGAGSFSYKVQIVYIATGGTTSPGTSFSW